ncbi:uncharacterized protein BXZ73DRAFT_99093 [Epithele typhae]|uniref:uncharacterized protein n=1 Tax=Epithele typhae TaxID=378194 RepID=UPI00200749B6|nr:uncharacterized protein BXZ73DRAFT_99093 [Epithele typhae]KAH9940092.1 hypothetical protein BXZ73DRAFT_99093 [Epithele typhae]
MPLPDTRGLAPCPERDTILRRIAEVDAERLRLNTSWNSTLPIHRLPPELIAKIFSTVLLSCAFTEVTDELPESRMRMALVCRRWKDLILSTPTLWTTLNVTPHSPLDMLSFNLSRSGESDLFVHVIATFDSNHLEVEAGVIELLSLEFTRIRTLVISGAVSPIIDSLFRDKAWPVLTRLHISLPRSSFLRQTFMRSDFRSALTITHQRFPVLCDLALRGFILVTDTQIRRQLTKFQLESPPSQWPPLPEFFAEISEASQLEALIVSPFDRTGRENSTSCDVDPELSGIVLPPFTLPRLRALNITSTRPYDLAPLIVHALRSQGPMSVDLHVPMWDHIFAPHISKGCHSIVDPLFHTHRECSTVAFSHELTSATLQIKRRKISFRGSASSSPAQGKPLTLSVTASRDLPQFDSLYPLSNALEDLSLLFRGMPLAILRVITCKGFANGARADGWRTVFRAFPNLETLAIKGSVDLEQLFEALRPDRPIDSADGAPAEATCLGSKLSTVAFDDEATQSMRALRGKESVAVVIEDCLRARERAGIARFQPLQMNLARGEATVGQRRDV